MPVATVAPAALTSTFETSVVGAGTYVLLAVTTSGSHIAPHWVVGIIAGAGGLIGGYLGAHLQSHVPEKVLCLALGFLAVATAVLYVAQVIP